MPARRREQTTLLTLLVLAGIAACGPPINDLNRLPPRINVCGWDWNLNTADAPITLAQVKSSGGANPIVVFDVTNPGCPRGACTAVDVRARQPLPGRCQTGLWVRVGFDAYVSYGMAFLL